MKIIVEFDNITEPQAIALEDLFKTMEWCGNIGTSRWTSFYSDGDGNFRPKILIDGEKPKFTELIERDKLWKDNEYRIDFDAIAWKLRTNKNK